jgi:hypothetical protein
MADVKPLMVVATHDLHHHAMTVPAGTPGEITAMTGHDPTSYTVCFRINGSGKTVTVDHVSRMDIHEA